MLRELNFETITKCFVEELMRGMMAIISVTNDVGRQKNNLQEVMRGKSMRGYYELCCRVERRYPAKIVIWK